MGVKWRDIENIDQIKIDAYPLITYNDGPNIHQVKTFEKQEQKISTFIVYQKNSYLIL